MTWQLSVVFWFIARITQNLYQRYYLKDIKLPSSVLAAVSNIIGTIPIGIIVGLSVAHHIHWDLRTVELLLAQGAFIGIFGYLAFQATKLLPVVQYQTVFQLYEIFIIIIAWIVLGEKLTIAQVIGSIILFVAALIAIRTKRSKKIKKSAIDQKIILKGLLFCLAGAACFAIGQIFEKACLGHMTIGAYFIFGYVAQALGSMGVAIPSAHTIKHIQRRDYKLLSLIGILSACNGFFYLYAIQHSHNISLIAGVGAFALPLMTLGAFIFLKEKYSKKLLFTSALLGGVGIFITSL